MRTRRRSMWLAAIGLAWLLLASLAGPSAWAADAVAPFGQTVPTRTPTAAPVTPTATLAPQPTATTTQVSPKPTANAASTPAAPALLPVAGGADAAADGYIPAIGSLAAGLGVFLWIISRNRSERRVRS